MSETSIDKNLRRAGEYFVYCLWLQNQMVDLIVLHDHPRIIKSFIKNPTKVPRTMMVTRLRLWQKDFKDILDEFKEKFKNSLDEEALNDLNFILSMRNAISHSSVSIGRDYFMYRPDGRRSRITLLKKAFRSSKNPDAAKPTIFRLDFKDDALYKKNFSVIKRLDEVVFKGIAELLRIPHSRIR